ncbi:MAG: hypothetical protein ACK4K7_00075 [Allosphingosinicella sp.]|uniref:hypothetical protein n=1 Tax=Allosphingosinicella sp. TaxID=2823234 RepID=UPI003943DF09
MLAILCMVDAEQELRWWQWGVLIVLAFDVVGGVAANATVAATRRYHRPERPYGPLLFSVAHVQPFILALLLPGLTTGGAALLWLSGALGTLLVIHSPPAVKRSVALGYCALAIAALSLLVPTSGLAWLAPAFVLKLVAAHAVPMWGAAELPLEER